ncbi:MAG: gliding motility-associated C-terminal domain-containing protein [Flavobacteriales bacterium]|jgi:gliding motility-associated-like protein|nr:gliding motility-associated C-terminal domain-containing protein [Flavobacteriales bacterium]
MNRGIKALFIVLLMLLYGYRVQVMAQCSIPSLIPNHNFESKVSCPTASGQITAATAWQETSNFSAEYYNCGFTNIASTYNAPPTPSAGTGYIGLANQSTGNKQYASACLSSGLIAGLSYTYQFDIAAANGSSSSLFNGATSDLSYTMVLYGNTACPVPAYPSNSCPSPADGWQVLTTVTITVSASEWTTHSIEFVPSANIQSIAIGPDCNTASNTTGLCSGGLCYNYYYLDNLILNLTNLYPTVEAGQDLTNDCTTPTNTLTANVSGGTPNFNYEWAPTTGLDNPLSQTPVANPTATTDYIVTISDANGCEDKDTIRVIVDKTPPNASAGPDKTINCTNPTITLAASGGGTYSWSPAIGLNSTSIASPSSSATATTNYTVTVIGDNGCVNTDEVLVTVDKDLPNAQTGPDITTSCNVPDAQLSASGGGTYSWSPNIALTNSTIANPIARPATTTTYTVTVTAPNGCESTASTTVTINTPTPLALPGNDIKRCGVNTVTFAPDLSTQLPIDTYLWTAANNNPSTVSFVDATDPNTAVNNLVEGTYQFYYTVANNICPAVTDSLLVFIYDPPFADAGQDDSLCQLYSTILNANIPQGTSSGTWSLQSNYPNPNPGAVVFSDVNNPNATVSGLSEGVYHLIWTVRNGVCPAARDTVEISVFDEPIAVAGVNDSLCGLYSVNLNASPALGTSTGVWTAAQNNPSMAIFSNDISPFSTISGLVEGTYTFQWTVSNGSCTSAVDTVYISVFDTPVAVAGTPLSICGEDTLNLDTLFFLNANDPVGTASGIWSVSQYFNNPSIPVFIDDTSHVTGVTNLLEGAYRLVWKVSNGNCTPAYDSVEILALDKPRAVVGDDQSWCAIYATDLEARTVVGNAVGEWSIPTNWNNPSTVTIDDVLDANSQVSGLIEGVYKLVWTVSNGNCDPATDTLTINIYDQPVADAGSDIELCAIYNTSLNAVDPIGTSSGVWSQDISYNGNTLVSFDDDTLNTTNSQNYIEGTYQLIWTVSNGVCNVDKDSVLVTIYDMPIADAGFDQYNCDVDTVEFSGQGNVGTAIGEWMLSPLYPYPSIPTFRDHSNGNTLGDNFIVGDYMVLWVVENGVCPSDTDTVFIHNMERPVAIANYEEQQCDNKCFEVVSLSTAPEGDGVLMHWIIDQQDYYDSVPEICITTAGEYEVKLEVTASNGCVDSLIDAPLIIVNPSPFADFEVLHETDSILELQRLDIENLASADVESYTYSMGNGDTIEEPDFLYFYHDFGRYNVTQWVENQYGCRDSVAIELDVKLRRSVFVPNTFTPNNDGLNDIFKPETRGLSEEFYEFTIYNRWGTLIFTSTSPSIGWDGTYKGETVEDDGYIWKLKYAKEDGIEIHQEQGHVMIYKYSRR